MAARIAGDKTSEQTAVESFGTGRLTLLPWTKQMLTVLWEQLRLLVQVIYYTFISVFQMFRFEVHLRITDETGEHIQHMSSAGNSPESFLFSSVVGGSNPLSNFCADTSDPFTGKSTAEALLSSFCAEDLCCGLVDDFVSRTASNEDAIFLGHPSAWKMGFSGDWNIFVSSGDNNSEKVCRQDPSKDTSEEERSFQWSSEEEQSLVEFDSEESKALWESLSKSSDPYNPFFFSACISTNTDMSKIKSEVRNNCETNMMSMNKTSEEMFGPPGLNMWLCRSDSESSWSSWAGSEGSAADVDKEESDKLWEFFSSPADPYNPMCFTAATASPKSPPTATASPCKQRASLPAPPPTSEPEEKDDSEEDLLWDSLARTNDPYHPLNFTARLQSSPPKTLQHNEENTVPDDHTKETKTPVASRPEKPTLPERKLKKHSHPEKTLAPWKRHEPSPEVPPKQNKSSTTQKKVRFSPLIQVHVMRTWLFARQATRKGHWEEIARDRDRFRRRISETEKSIGHCFSESHREKIRANLDQKRTKSPAH